jgi:hypothetical protein
MPLEVSANMMKQGITNTLALSIDKMSKGEALLWVPFALDLKFHPWTTMSPPYTLIMRHKRERDLT